MYFICDCFFIDITYTEKTGKIEWMETPSEAEEYGVKDMSIESMMPFFEKLASDSETMDKFINRMKVYVPFTCDAKCRKAIACVVMNPNNEDAEACIRAK